MIDWRNWFLSGVSILAIVFAFVAVGTLFVAAFLQLDQEEAPDGTSRSFYSYSAEAKTILGHEYIIFIRHNGISALHAASCPCHGHSDK